jgi:hypothetical protein
MLIRYGGQHVQHMQKALEQMNVKLAEVVSDVNHEYSSTDPCRNLDSRRAGRRLWLP